jgi:hypothetical protein
MTLTATEASFAPDPRSDGADGPVPAMYMLPLGYSLPAKARWAESFRGAASPAPADHRIDWNLVMVRQHGWQSLADWHRIAGYVRDIEPRIATFIVRGDHPRSYVARLAARRPSLVFSPGRIMRFAPLRGRVYQGRAIAKMEQLRRLAASDVRVPRSALLTPDLRLDPAVWGDFVIVKPTDLVTSSNGVGIQLIRTSRVRFKKQSDYPRGHPGSRGPMLVQQFIDTGDRVAVYRVLALFGEPLYIILNIAKEPRIDLAAPDDAIEKAPVATNIAEREKLFVRDADVIAMARAAHAALPEIPLKGCDIARDAKTGALYVLELNPGGNTWHFSSDILKALRRENGAEFERRRREQFDALRTAARVLVERTRNDAE